MSRRNICLRCMLFAFLVIIVAVGTIIAYEKVVESTDSDEQTFPVMIDAEGIVQNGPFRTCECSGNIFFGEDRVECLQERSHRPGDVVVFCIWNEMLQIRAIDHAFVKMNQDRSYQLIQDGIPDIHTQSFLQTRAAAVTTVLDPVWFMETSIILGLQVELQGEAHFNTTEEYDALYWINARQHTYHGLRQMTEIETGRSGSKKPSKSIMIAAVATVLVLAAAFIFAMGCFASSLLHKQEARLRSEYWEYIRRRQLDEFGKYLSDHGELDITMEDSLDEISDDSTADMISTNAQIAGDDEEAMRTLQLNR